MNTFRIIAEKQNEKIAGVEILVNEYTKNITLTSGDKSPNISFTFGDGVINLTSGVYTQHLEYNLEMVKYFTLGLALNKTIEYYTDYLILSGWQIVLKQ